MNKIKIYDTNKNQIDMNLIFSFFCKENKKTYIAVENGSSIFEDNSNYSNIDVLEVIKEINHTIYVSNIPDKDWPLVKNTIQHTVFSKIK